MKYLEHNLQVQCVEWFRWKFKGSIINAVPNGARRDVRTGFRLKQEGMLKGFPDLSIWEPNRKYHGMLIEMKVKGNYPSPEQKDLMKRLADKGYCTALCYSFDEFEDALTQYMGER